MYDDRNVKTKIRAYGDKVYTKFRGLNVSKEDVESESFSVISIESLLVYENRYYLQVHLDNCTYKTENKWQIILATIFLEVIKINSYKSCITIELI